MAKLKDLAGLAALGALGYQLSQKNQGMVSGQDDNDALANANRISKMSADSDTLARVNSNMSPGQNAVNDTNAGVLNAITAPKSVDDTSNYSNEGRSSKPSPSKPMAKTMSKPKAVSRGMSEAQNDMLAKAGRDVTDAQNYGNESMRPVTSAPTMLPGSDPFEAFRSGTRNPRTGRMMNKGGSVKKMASGGMTSSASKRADGIATKGKTRGKIC
jgi:hypothetical protein